ncbi:SEC-C domain-containing protein [Nocardiopsis sp. CC223A]|uniref:SEC-C domain-containing protein n=1 Tax=Nocardiopsis sp. CC223A TaxID=3044051 RepID=UPI00278C3EE9|nr:SEC-C domain-containing protein [Nocardiopsis sp. CC223A]
MAEDTSVDVPPTRHDDALMTALRALDLPEAVLRDAQAHPQERREILMDAVAADLLPNGRRDQALRVLRALREHPPTPEDGQYAAIELAYTLRESGAPEDTAEADRITAELLRPGNLEKTPAFMLADELRERGATAEALHCYNIAARAHLVRPAEEIEDLGPYDLELLMHRADMRMRLGFAPDAHDVTAIAVAAREMALDDGEPGWEDDLPPGEGEPDMHVEVLFARESFEEARDRGLLTGETAEHGADAYYRAAEAMMRGQAREHPGTPQRVLLHGVAEITAFAEDAGLDPAERRTHLEWARATTTVDGPWSAAWPPGRNEPCWCGSTRKYKKCCGSPTHR